ncbi:MAG: hypothetical protein ACXWZ1_08715, partial [Gaiellaceae bacterium]
GPRRSVPHAPLTVGCRLMEIRCWSGDDAVARVTTRERNFTLCRRRQGFESWRTAGKQVGGCCGRAERDPRHRLCGVKRNAARNGVRRHVEVVNSGLF